MSLPFAGAQESVKLQPAIIETRVEPGQVLTETVRVSNLTDTTKTYYLLARDILDVVNGGQPLFAEPGQNLESGVRAWISLTQPSVTLSPNETKDVSFRVTVPEDAFPGGHFGGIFLSLEPVRPDTIGTGIGYQVGTILSFRVAGEAREEARIREFTIDKNIYSKADVKFGVKVENLGNVLVRPRGPLQIQNMFGKEVASLIVNDENAAVFPGKDRSFEVAWQSDGLAFGRYQATLSLVYGEDARDTISDSVSFWVLPVNLIVPALVGIVLVVLIAFGLLRWYIRKKVRELGGDRPDRGPEPPAAFSRLLFMTMAALLFVLLLLGLLFVLFS